MTNIEFTLADGVLCFSCIGHSYYAEKGKDIVCAGISALCKAMYERIRVLESEKQTEIKKYRASDGSLLLHFTLTEKAEECCKTVMCGFEFIAKTYPENCRVSVLVAE